MRRKVLKDYANTFCQMAADYHLLYQEDLEEMAEVGDGLLEVDVLAGEGRIDGRRVPRLRFPYVMTDWFRNQLRTKHISARAIQKASIIVRFSVRLEDIENPLGLDAHCSFDCVSEILTDEICYRGVSHRTCVRGLLRDPAKHLGKYYWARDAGENFGPAWLGG